MHYSQRTDLHQGRKTVHLVIATFAFFSTGIANGLRNQYYDPDSPEWLVLFCINMMTCAGAARYIYENKVPVLYRNYYNADTWRATDNVMYIPV